MSRRLFVSRHPGAVAWARRHLPGFEPCGHLDPDALEAADVVAGNLPVPLVAALTARGVHYARLIVPVSAAERGRELPVDELERRGAHLRWYRAEETGPPDDPAVPLASRREPS